MPDDTRSPNQSPNFSSPKEERPSPKIRTMESDIQTLFKDGKENIVSAMAKEESAKKFPLASKVLLAEPRHKKLWLLIVGIGLVVLAALGLYAWFFSQQSTTPQTPVEQTVIPRPYFSMEKSRNIIVRSFSYVNFPQDLKIIENDKERDGIMKRIVTLIQDDTGQGRLATPEEFFLAANITPAKPLLENIGTDYNFFLYYQNNGQIRRGVALPILNETKAFRAMIDAEPTLRGAWGPLYDPADPKGTLAAFEDITYRNIDIRRLQLSTQTDIGFYYAIFKPKKLLVITTSYESMRVALDRIFDSF